MGGRKKKHYRKGEMLTAVKGSGGIVTTIAAKLGCDWHTAKANIDRYEETREAYRDELETGLDLVEGKAFERARGGDGTMIRFILATKGRARGYGDAPPPESIAPEDNTLRIEIDDSAE
ncbi:hypothetical protein E4N71_07575 [Treponema vincentii]|uniref:hypothetical protein n=1 Tax=Treponema vincentii TaxID=69710 RepID=UPI003D941DC2